MICIVSKTTYNLIHAYILHRIQKALQLCPRGYLSTLRLDSCMQVVRAARRLSRESYIKRQFESVIYFSHHHQLFLLSWVASVANKYIWCHHFFYLQHLFPAKIVYMRLHPWRPSRQQDVVTPGDRCLPFSPGTYMPAFPTFHLCMLVDFHFIFSIYHPLPRVSAIENSAINARKPPTSTCIIYSLGRIRTRII